MQNDNLLKENFEKMNPEQQKAIKCTEGPLLILAGAGSGKTTVLVNRIANIIHSGLARPYEILAITFTNKAANELKSRITNLLSDSANDIWASTFHSTCARILRIYADRLGFSKHFSIYDTDDSKRLIKEVQRVFEIDDKILSHKSIMKEISRAKDNMISVNEYIKNAKNDSRLCEIAKVYETYQNRLKDADAMDFDDIIYNTVLLLNSNQDILEHYQNQFKYVLVDEYQDTNFIQYEFIRLLSLKHHNLCVVGDDDQSIYKFRGATIDNILNFEKTFANTKIIKLEQNYRSTQIILDAANAMIKNNNERKGKNLWTENKNGEKISVHTAVNEQDEAEYIAQQILDFVSNGKKFSDFAVLYRMNSQSNTIERIFAKSGIPYKVVGGMRFYDRKEIKDILSYMSVIANHSDDTRLRRIINYPKRSIGSKTLAIASEIASQQQVSVFKVLETAYLYPELNRSIIKTGAFVDLIHSLTDFAKNPNHSLHEIYETIIQETKIIDEIKKEKDDSENRIQNINELASNILQYEKENPDNATLSGFLEQVSLLTDLDSKDAKVRNGAMRILEDFSSPVLIDRFEKIAQSDPDPSNRYYAQKRVTSLKSSQRFNSGIETVYFGLSLGSVLVLAAIGLTVTFGVMGVINMAHGELMMIGAYTTYVIQQLLPSYSGIALILSIPAAFIVAGLVGIAIERCVIRFLYGRPLETLLATFGISLLLQQAVRSIFTALNKNVVIPDFMSGSVKVNEFLFLTYNRLYIIIFCLVVFFSLRYFLQHSTLGVQVRAVSQNRAMARNMGVHSGRVNALTFGLGSAIAGLAGVALSQLTNVGPNLGQNYIVDSFLVVVFGGAGNIWGTLVAGMTLGIANKVIEPIYGAMLAKIIILVGVILFIQKRPRGLFPQHGRSVED